MRLADRLILTLKQPTSYLVLSLVILIIRTLQYNRPGILMDDAFISFRYAQNLAAGSGLVFNIGERVEGYTNFLWTTLLAVCASLGFDLVPASKVLAALAAAGCLLIMFQLGKLLFKPQPRSTLYIALPLLLYAAMGSQARYIVSGMETLLFAFFLCLGVYFYVSSKRPLITGAIYALCAMTRPEGVMYFTLVFGFTVLMQIPFVKRLPFLSSAQNINPLPTYARRESILFLLGFLLPFLTYFLWRYDYYGYILPNTFYVKASDFQWARIGRGWDFLLQLVSWWSLGPILVLAFFALLSQVNRRIWLLFWVLIGATAAYFVYVGGDFIVWFGPRFLMPVLPFILLLSSAGLVWLGNLRFIPSRSSVWIQIGISAILLINAYGYAWPARYFNPTNFTAQMQGWTEMGRWIKDNTPSNTTLATDAAGLIPYYSNRYTIDMFGLTDEHIAHLPVSARQGSVVAHEKFDPQYVLRRQPDCIVSTWMDREGNAISAGLSEFAGDFNNTYNLVAVSKTRYGPPDRGRWIIVTSTYKPKMYDTGYQTGLFCKEGIRLTHD
jgi:hypothetical protein